MKNDLVNFKGKTPLFLSHELRYVKYSHYPYRNHDSHEFFSMDIISIQVALIFTVFVVLMLKFSLCSINSHMLLTVFIAHSHDTHYFRCAHTRYLWCTQVCPPAQKGISSLLEKLVVSVIHYHGYSSGLNLFWSCFLFMGSIGSFPSLKNRSFGLDPRLWALSPLCCVL